MAKETGMQHHRFKHWGGGSFHTKNMGKVPPVFGEAGHGGVGKGSWPENFLDFKSIRVSK